MIGNLSNAKDEQHVWLLSKDGNAYRYWPIFLPNSLATSYVHCNHNTNIDKTPVLFRSLSTVAQERIKLPTIDVKVQLSVPSLHKNPKL